MQSIIRNFLWDYGGSSRMHWIGWKTVCLPKKDGGLGLRSLWDSRRFCLHKLAWSFLENRSLWAWHASHRFKVGKAGSGIWNSVSLVVRLLIRDSFWDIGDGGTKLSHFCLWLNVEVPAELSSDSIFEVLSNQGKLGLLLNNLPVVMHGLFLNMSFSDRQDVLLWRKATNGCFSSKVFHSASHSDSPGLRWFRLVWCKWIPPKLSAFAWKVFHRRVPTDENVKKFGFPFPSKCWCCVQAAEESSDHLFFKGDVAVRLWSFVAKVFGIPAPSSLPLCLKSWFSSPRNNSFMDNLSIGVATCVLWEIWMHRNQLRWEGVVRPGISEIKRWAFRMFPLIQGFGSPSLGTRLSLQLLELPPFPTILSKGLWAAWCPAVLGLTLSMNVLGTSVGFFVGGVLRDCEGSLVSAFRLQCESDCLFSGISLIAGWLKALRISPSCVQSSHPLLACLIDPRRPPSLSSRNSWKECLALIPDISFMIIHKLHNIPASILSFHGSLGFTRNLKSLPRSVKIALASDKFPRFLG